NLAELSNKNRSRPRKGAAGRRARMKAQVKRLEKLGVPAAMSRQLNADDLRALLKRPLKLKKKLANQG
ncbi:MAG: hypothetical protein KBA51_07485, partial [Kiritimatiellae bacterium]|nr:hypothetical protein [Kiritimatiellia bacterium]